MEISKIATMLKERRIAKELTQAELAKKSGVSIEAIVAIEEMKSKPTVDNFTAIANALGMNFAVATDVAGKKFFVFDFGE